MADDRDWTESGGKSRRHRQDPRHPGEGAHDDWDFDSPPAPRGRAGGGAGGAASPPAGREPNHRVRQAVAVAAGAAVLIVAVILLLGSCGSPGEDAVRKYSQAWSKGDWAAMYEQLTPESQKKISLIEFAQAGREALATATAPENGVRTGEPQAGDDGEWLVPTTVRTRIFGTVSADTLLRVDTEGDEKKIAWSPSQVFPGLRSGEQLTRETVMPARGTLLARDGTVLAKGPDRSSPIPEVASEVVGQVGPVPPEMALETSSLGYPPDAQVGTSGLERIFNPQLGGLPSGSLKAGPRSISLQGKGNGPIAAFVDALHTLPADPAPRFEVAYYCEHALGSGSEASAIAYIQIRLQNGQTRWGAGIDTNIELASIKAVLSAVNRASA